MVERSVTIACITTREVILKDFATETDDTKMRKAAHLMVASMSGSLALITAKEPLRNAIGTHLRALLPTSAGDPQQLEHVIQVCSNENTDLGCMLIEKASSEKAMRDIDEALAGAYASRRRYQQQQAQAGKAPGADGVHFFEEAQAALLWQLRQAHLVRLVATGRLRCLKSSSPSRVECRLCSLLFTRHSSASHVRLPCRFRLVQVLVHTQEVQWTRKEILPVLA